MSAVTCPSGGHAGGVEVEVSATRGKGEGATSVTVRMSYPGEAVADFEAAKAECRSRGLEIKS